ncbi:hypothetical protein ACE6H2_001941 [Prunus campanulata]
MDCYLYFSRNSVITVEKTVLEQAIANMSFRENMCFLAREIATQLESVSCWKGQWLGIWVLSYLLWGSGE